MKNKSKILEFYLPALIWAGLIFYLSAEPAQVSLPLIFKDKIAHLGVYFILAFLIARLFSQFEKLSTKKVILISIVLVSFYGITDEFHQHFVPGRTVDFFDWVADTLGAVLGVGAFWFISNFRKPKMLLHACCASCGLYSILELRKLYRLTIFWYNPNIEPKKEHNLRLNDAREMCRRLNLKLIEGKYENSKWHKFVADLESEPEGGKRCIKCFDFRLEETFKQAKKLKIKNTATTLTVGPTKNAKIINSLGRQKAQKYGINYYEADFKKNEGFKKSVELSKAWNFYRQDYCGCEFSKRK